MGASALIRDKYKYSILLEDTQELMTTKFGVVIEKTRHTLEHGGLIWEVDMLEGKYAGLIAEVTGAALSPIQPLATEEFTEIRLIPFRIDPK